MAKIRYTVHSAHTTQVPREVSLNGAKVSATVPAFVVELVSEDEGMGHTFSFVGADADDAAKLFEAGSTVTATFKKDT